MLDGQVGDAAVRIEDPRSHQRLRGTRLETEGAGPALVERRPIGRQFQAADHLAKEDPRSERRIDDAGVFPDPTDTSVPRVDALEDRTRVDVGARVERLRRALTHPREEGLEPRADHLVIVVAPGIT